MNRRTHTREHRAVADEIWPHAISYHIVQHLHRAFGVPELDIPETNQERERNDTSHFGRTPTAMQGKVPPSDDVRLDRQSCHDILIFTIPTLMTGRKHQLVLRMAPTAGFRPEKPNVHPRYFLYPKAR